MKMPWFFHNILVAPAAMIYSVQKAFEIGMLDECGYVRVSREGETLDAQIKALRAAGAERVFQEKIRGGVTDRTQLRRAIAALSNGDLLLVTRLDSLARSTQDLINILAEVTSKGAGFRSLRDSWADTTTPHGPLMLAVLAELAAFQREFIRSRRKEGSDRAKARGVRLGRKPKLTAHQRREALERRDAGEPLSAIGRSYGVSRYTISRLHRRMLQEEQQSKPA